MCLLASLLYFPYIFLGYGSDDDSDLVLNCGKQFVETGQYHPSRNPGFLVYEAITWLLNRLGGSLLCNLGTLAISLLCISSFIYICHRFSIPHRRLLAAILIIHPVYGVQSTCTMDYMWALSFALGGIVLLLKEKYVAAGVIFAMAIGSRCTSFTIVAPVLVYFYLINPGARKKVILSGVIALLLAGSFYIPSFWSAHWTLAFLKPHYADVSFWTPYLKVAKGIYRNIYFWGFPTTFILAIMLWKAFVFLRQTKDVAPWFPILAMCFGSIGFNELAFFGAPAEIPYLLPILPFVLIATGILLQRQERLLWVFLVLLAIYNILNINIARPNIKHAASSATYGLWIEPGYLVQDIKDRLKLNSDRNEATQKVP